MPTYTHTVTLNEQMGTYEFRVEGVCVAILQFSPSVPREFHESTLNAIGDWCIQMLERGVLPMQAVKQNVSPILPPTA